MDTANEIKMYSLDDYSYVKHIVVPNIDIKDFIINNNKFIYVNNSNEIIKLNLKNMNIINKFCYNKYNSIEQINIDKKNNLIYLNNKNEIIYKNNICFKNNSLLIKYKKQNKYKKCNIFIKPIIMEVLK